MHMLVKSAPAVLGTIGFILLVGLVLRALAGDFNRTASAAEQKTRRFGISRRMSRDPAWRDEDCLALYRADRGYWKPKSEKQIHGFLAVAVILMFRSMAHADGATSTFDFNFSCADNSCAGQGVITATEVPQGAVGWLGWQIDSIAGTYDGFSISAIPGESIGDIYQTASYGAYLPTLGFMANGSAVWWEWYSGDVIPFEYVGIQQPQGGYEDDHLHLDRSAHAQMQHSFAGARPTAQACCCWPASRRCWF